MTPTPADDVALPELERLRFLIDCISQAAKDRGRDWQSMVIDISEAVETAEKVRAEVAAAIAADRAKRAGWPEGWVLVPKEATDKMCAAFSVEMGCGHDFAMSKSDAAFMYSIFMEAAPPAPTQTQPAQTQENKG